MFEISKLGPLTLLSLCLGSCVTVFAGDWSGWRGSHHDGVSTEADPPTVWSAETNVAWKAAVPGLGHSSPIVVGDRVIVTTCDVKEESRMVICFDRASGEQLWQTVVAHSPIEQMHQKNSPASSTPVSNGKIVVATFVVDDQYLAVAIDIDGDLLWKRAVGPFVSRHGFHSCPILYENTILLSGLQDSDQSFVARLAIDSGSTLWKTNTNTQIRSFSPPHITRCDNQPAVVVSGANCTSAYDLESGERIWRVPGPAEKTVSSIVETDSRLFIAGGRDSKLIAVDVHTYTPSQPAWTSTAGVPYTASPILAFGDLHQVSDEGVYTRIDVRNGKTLGKKRLLGPTSASPIFAGGRLYCTDESGRTVVAELQPKLKVVSDNELDEPVFASLAVADQDLFIRGVRQLFCIRTGVAQNVCCNHSAAGRETRRQRGTGAPMSTYLQTTDPEIPANKKREPLLAAQYVRMSTEHQQYSTTNQEDVIRIYRGYPTGVEPAPSSINTGLLHRQACVPRTPQTP